MSNFYCHPGKAGGSPLLSKAVFAGEKSGESEWMWVKVHRADGALRVVFGELD